MNSSLAARIGPWPLRHSVEGRMATVLLALLPVLLAEALRQGPPLLARMAMALAVALPLDAVLLAARGRPPLGLASLLNAAGIALLLALLLPAAMPYWALPVAIVVAIAIARHAFGSQGHELFNPVMTGCAVISLSIPSWPVMAEAASPPWTGAACGLGAVLLLWSGVTSWRAPLAMLAAAALASLALAAPDAQVGQVDPTQVIAVLLTAFFIVGDPASGCATPRGRLAFGAGCGALSIILGRGGATLDGLAFAVLGMNAVAPWLDRRLAPRRVGARP